MDDLGDGLFHWFTLAIQTPGTMEELHAAYQLADLLPPTNAARFRQEVVESTDRVNQIVLLPWDRRSSGGEAAWVFTASIDTTGRNLGRAARILAHQLTKGLESIPPALHGMRGMRVQDIHFPGWDKTLLIGAALIDHNLPHPAVLYHRFMGPAPRVQAPAATVASLPPVVGSSTEAVGPSG